MTLFQLRPTFEIPLSENRLEAIAKLETEFARSKKGDHFLMHGEYGELHLPAVEHRLWSPHLSFYVSGRNEQCLIHGTICATSRCLDVCGVIYLAMSFAAFFGFALAYSQWMLGESGWGLWVAAVALLAIMVLYVVANVGQQLSADQMSALRSRLDIILQNAGVLIADDQSLPVGHTCQV